ncbi:MAG TPA: RNA polymerase subunit sigma-70, partial [Prevotellaceae bacterium]|nr:RNA polymerase subunit sigma-70 [Prevotellaceae bacterium]
MDTTEQQFAETIRRHKSTIYTVCYMFSKDNDEVGDMFQEVLVNLWKGFPGFQGESDIKTWIYRIALNTCISLDRKKKRRWKTVSLPMNINLYHDNDHDTRQVKMLYDRITRLGLFDRPIILLWLDAVPYDEIARIVGLTTKN